MPELTLEQIYLRALQNFRAGKFDEADALLSQIIQRQPAHAESWRMRGIIAYRRGQAEQAVSFLQRAAAIDPASAPGFVALATTLVAANRPEQAINAYRQAIQLDPANAEAHNNLGALLLDARDITGAMRGFQEALRLRADYPEATLNLALAHANLAFMHQMALRIDEAISGYRESVKLNPKLFAGWLNLGQALVDTAALDEAIACFQRAHEITGVLSSNYLFAIHLHPDIESRRIFDEHARWGASQANLRQFQSHKNSPDPNRRIRIGYHSPNFRNHPVARFLLPLLENHDRSRFEICCFSDVRRKDEVTEKVRKLADEWTDTAGLSDEALAQCVHADGIDIFVDLTLHGEGTRLASFARKPAPVEATYLAYCSTSGLNSIDYRLTDSFLDPPELSTDYYSESSIRLRSYWCYQADHAPPEINPLPARARGAITFGNLNSLQKVSTPALQAWAQILQDVSRSRLILHALGGSHRARIGDFFASRGVDAKRVEFVGYLPIEQYFRAYQSIDVALDPFPYNGGMTSCDALWMGVPVVTLAGNTAVSRGGCSILNQIGIPQWIAHSHEQYIRCAVELAEDIESLEAIRSSMRRQMQQSPLMDAAGFARDVEQAFAQMWKGWCQRQSGAGGGNA